MQTGGGGAGGMKSQHRFQKQRLKVTARRTVANTRRAEVRGEEALPGNPRQTGSRALAPRRQTRGARERGLCRPRRQE